MFLNIQWLRACGAIMVLLYHLLPHYRALGGPDTALNGVIAFGFVGVDVFFVVSGFVMMHVVRGRPPSPSNVRDFLGRRLVRIYGWYLPCAALAVLAAWAYDPAAFERINLVRSAFLASVHVPELALQVSWTLSYELYFYFLFAAAWVLAPNRLVPVLWASAAALWVFSSLIPYRSGTLLSFVATPLMLEFIAGALLYEYRTLAARRASLLACAAGAVFFSWLGARYNATNDFSRIWTFGAGSLFLVALLVGLEEARLHVAGRLSKALGDASYTIYLLHLPFIAAFHFSGAQDMLRQLGAGWAVAGLAASVAVFLAACVYLHYAVELPLYRWLCKSLRLAPNAGPVRLATS